MNMPTSLQTNATTGVRSVIVACAMGLLLMPGCSPARIDATSTPVQSELSGTSYRLTGASIVDEVPVSTAPPGLRLLAPGSAEARIIDEDRNVLMAAPSNGTIFNMRMNPGQGLILIYHGDAQYQIVSADSFDAVASLPARPPAQEDATGFSWRWLGNDHLLGSAALPSTDTQGKSMAEIEGLSPRATLLYVYRLEDGSLTPVQIEPTLPQAFIIQQTSGWNVTLLTHDEQWVGARIETTAPP